MARQQIMSEKKTTDKVQVFFRILFHLHGFSLQSRGERERQRNGSWLGKDPKIGRKTT